MPLSSWRPPAIAALSALAICGRRRARQLAAPDAEDRLVGAFEEDVGELDLLGAAGIGDGEGVDLLLDRVAADVGVEVGALDAVGLVVDDQRRLALRFDQEVDRSAQDRAGDFDQERDLGPRALGIPHPLGEEGRVEPGAGLRQERRRRAGLARLGPGGRGEALDELLGGPGPAVRLAPLEQRVNRDAAGSPVLT